MKLRTKLFAGLLLLFVVISLLAGIGGYAVYKLDKSSERIIQDNFVSVDYSVLMLSTLDNIKSIQYELIKNPTSKILNEDYQQAQQQFKTVSQAQASNITEKNEAYLVSHLQKNYQKLINNFDKLQRSQQLNEANYSTSVVGYYAIVKADVLKIYELNKTAVLAKNKYAQGLAQNNSILIITLGLASVGITFLFILYFPIYITRPLERIRVRLQAVSNYDYSQRLEINTDDELGQLATIFNKMVYRLKEYQESSLAQLMYRVERDEAVMNQLQEGVLILDENLKVVAINDLLAYTMNVAHPKEWIGKYAPDMAVKNNLMRKLIAPTMKPRSVDEAMTLQENNRKNTRILCIENKGQEQSYQVTQKDFYVSHNGNEQFAGFIITVREFNTNPNQKVLGQVQTNAFINQLQGSLEEWKQHEVNAHTLQHINQLLDTTQNFNNTLNGRLNSIN